MRSHKDQRGAALLIVLVLAATLSALALALTQSMDRAVKKAMAASARDRAVWALLGAEQGALSILERQAAARTDVDTPSEPWLSQPRRLPIDDGLLTVRFIDRSACLNVNDLVDETSNEELVTDEIAIEGFSQFFAEIGGSEIEGARLATVVADFIDEDGRVGQGGAEDYAYTSGPAPRLTAGRTLVEVSELRGLPGWTGPVYRAVAPYLCVVPGLTTPNPINLNTIRPEDAILLRVALGFSVAEPTLERLIEARPPDGFDTVDAFLSQPAIGNSETLPPGIETNLATYATYIEFSAQVVYGEREFRLSSFIVGQEGGSYRVVARRFGEPDL